MKRWRFSLQDWLAACLVIALGFAFLNVFYKFAPPTPKLKVLNWVAVSTGVVAVFMRKIKHVMLCLLIGLAIGLGMLLIPYWIWLYFDGDPTNVEKYWVD